MLAVRDDEPAYVMLVFRENYLHKKNDIIFTPTKQFTTAVTATATKANDENERNKEQQTNQSEIK